MWFRAVRVRQYKTVTLPLVAAILDRCLHAQNFFHELICQNCLFSRAMTMLQRWTIKPTCKNSCDLFLLLLLMKRPVQRRTNIAEVYTRASPATIQEQEAKDEEEKEEKQWRAKTTIWRGPLKGFFPLQRQQQHQRNNQNRKKNTKKKPTKKKKQKNKKKKTKKKKRRRRRKRRKRKRRRRGRRRQRRWGRGGGTAPPS